MRRLSRRTALAAACLLALACGRSASPPADDAAEPGSGCVDRVLALDEALGSARNHAPENAPLADAVRDYVAALESLSFDGCPDFFRDAFERHRLAWAASIPFFERHDALRGEMHDLFDAIRELGEIEAEALKRHEEAIWGTWAEVEAAAGR